MEPSIEPNEFVREYVRQNLHVVIEEHLQTKKFLYCARIEDVMADLDASPESNSGGPGGSACYRWIRTECIDHVVSRTLDDGVIFPLLHYKGDVYALLGPLFDTMERAAQEMRKFASGLEEKARAAYELERGRVLRELGVLNDEGKRPLGFGVP